MFVGGWARWLWTLEEHSFPRTGKSSQSTWFQIILQVQCVLAQTFPFPGHTRYEVHPPYQCVAPLQPLPRCLSSAALWREHVWPLTSNHILWATASARDAHMTTGEMKSLVSLPDSRPQHRNNCSTKNISPQSIDVSCYPTYTLQIWQTLHINFGVLKSQY